MKNILILDDDEDLCWVMSVLLLDHGAASCVCVHSLEELQELGQDFKFDLAILDINLGRSHTTGLDAYHWLHKHNYTGKSVFFTGHAKSDPLTRSALKLPNTGLLEKPASVEAVLALLK